MIFLLLNFINLIAQTYESSYAEDVTVKVMLIEINVYTISLNWANKKFFVVLLVRLPKKRFFYVREFKKL